MYVLLLLSMLWWFGFWILDVIVVICFQLNALVIGFGSERL